MTDEGFKIGDLVYIIRDCYVFNFIGQRAKISKTGDFGIVVQTDAPEIEKDDFLMHQFWQNSVKIQISHNLLGWVLIDNIVLMNNEKIGER